jgi:hypothetical protein
MNQGFPVIATFLHTERFEINNPYNTSKKSETRQNPDIQLYLSTSAMSFHSPDSANFLMFISFRNNDKGP